MADTTFNGHPTWDHWNVSLWIGNDEGLYALARDCKNDAADLHDAAEAMLDYMNGLGLFKTPDGARYTVETVAHALEGLE